MTWDGVQEFVRPPGPAQAWLPRPYQQLLRGPNLRWWRPLVSLGVVLTIAGVALVAAVVLFGIYLALTGAFEPGASPSGSSGPGGASSAEFDAWSVTPVGLLANNLLLAALIPVSQVALWVGFGWRPRWLSSVVGGLRWRLLAGCYLGAVLVIGALTVLTVLLPASLGGGADGWTPEPAWPWLLLVVLISTPLQAAGEEYLFRGWMQQTIGAMFARPVPGALVGGSVSTILFALAHGQQDPWLFADRFAFGAVASYLAWRTGGLEAGMALHGVNNLTAFGFTIASGQLQQSLNPTRSDPTTLAVNLVVLLVAMAAVLGVSRRLRVVRLFTPPQPMPPGL